MRIALGLLAACWAGVAAAEVPKIAQDVCAACHGPTGTATDAQFPGIAGQPSAYLALQLHAFRSGARPSEVMAPTAESLSDADITALAAYFAAQTPGTPPAPEAAPAAADVNRGAWLYTARGRGAPPCVACHDPSTFRMNGMGMGRGPMMTDPAVTPRLYGLPATYIADQLAAFAEGRRPSTVMGQIAARLGPADRISVAAYLSQIH